jgi:hypothetical protein
MSMSKKDIEELTTFKYWEDRYKAAKTSPQGNEKKDEDEYEWFQTFEAIQPWLTKYLPAISDDGPAVLHLGNGLSV